MSWAAWWSMRTFDQLPPLPTSGGVWQDEHWLVKWLAGASTTWQDWQAANCRLLWSMRTARQVSLPCSGCIGGWWQEAQLRRSGCPPPGRSSAWHKAQSPMAAWHSRQRCGKCGAGSPGARVDPAAASSDNGGSAGINPVNSPAGLSKAWFERKYTFSRECNPAGWLLAPRARPAPPARMATPITINQITITRRTAFSSIGRVTAVRRPHSMNGVL